LRLEAGLLKGKASPPIEIAPLNAYVLARPKISDETRAAAASDAANLQETLKWHSENGGWPPKTAEISFEKKSGEGLEIEANLPGELRAWTRGFRERAERGDGSGGYAQVLRLRDALVEFEDQEKALHQLSKSDEPPAEWMTQWKEKFAALSVVEAKVRLLLPVLAHRTLARAFDEELVLHQKAQKVLMQKLLDETKAVVSDGKLPPELAVTASSPAAFKARVENLVAIQSYLSSFHKELDTETTGQKAIRDQLPDLDEAFVEGEGLTKRFAMYKAGDERLAEQGIKEASLTPGEAGRRLGSLKGDGVQLIAKAVEPVVSAGPKSKELLEAGKAVAIRAIDMGIAGSRTSLVLRVVGDSPNTAEAIRASVRGLAASTDARKLDRPQLPLTGRDKTFDLEFAPAAAAAYLKDYFEAANTDGSKKLLTNVDDKIKVSATAAADYLQQYIGYWTAGIAKLSGDRAHSAAPWADYRKQIGIDPGDYTRMLGEMAKAQRAAVEAIRPLADAAKAAGDTESAGRIEQLDSAQPSTNATNKLADFNDSVKECVRNWLRLDALPDQARQGLLREIPTNLEGYFAAPVADDAVRTYFGAVCAEGFRVLADDHAVNIDRDIDLLLNTLNKFPLAPWRASGEELTLSDVEQARTAIARVFPAQAAAMTAGADKRLCARKWPEPIWENVRRMLNCDRLTELEVQGIDDIRRRLAAIPEPDPTGVAALTFIADKRVEGAANDIRDRQSMKLAGSTVRNAEPVNTQRGQLLGNVGIFSGPVSLELFEDVDGKKFYGRSHFENTTWLPLYIYERFCQQPVSGGSFEAVVPVTTEKGEVYNVPVKVGLPAELKLWSK